MKFGKRHDTMDFRPCQLFTDMISGRCGETGVKEFGLNSTVTRGISNQKNHSNEFVYLLVQKRSRDAQGLARRTARLMFMLCNANLGNSAPVPLTYDVIFDQVNGALSVEWLLLVT